MKNLEHQSDHIENLIHTYLSGTISQKDKDDLFRWLIKDAGNVAYFNQLSDIWLSSSVFRDVHDFNANEAFDRVKAKIDYVNTEVKETNVKYIRLTWQKAAAILIPILLVTGLASKWLFSNQSNVTVSPFVFEVPYGSKATLQLPDGSKVVLNAGSKLTCREGFGKINRDLTLVGEGYFNVAKNKNLPFVVHAGNLYVKALGTEFDVKAYPEDKDIKAILIHGSIKIDKVLSQGTSEKTVILQPKQSLVYNKKTDRYNVSIPIEKNKDTEGKNVSVSPGTEVVVSKTTIDPVIYTTWKESSWTIYDLNLSDLAVELERKYDVNIHFGSEALKNIRFSGTLPDISLEQVLAAVRLISPIEYKIQGKQVELTENQSLMPAYKKYYSNSEQN